VRGLDLLIEIRAAGAAAQDQQYVIRNTVLRIGE